MDEDDQVAATVQATVNAFRLPFHMREDALSEGWVAALEARQSYNGKIPLQPWLILNIRWRLREMLRNELKRARDCDIDGIDRPVSLDAVHEFRCACDILRGLGAGGVIVLQSAYGYQAATLSRMYKLPPAKLKAVRVETVKALKAQMEEALIV